MQVFFVYHPDTKRIPGSVCTVWRENLFAKKDGRHLLQKTF